MFDFRYHALSLVAVFVALAVGLLLGVAIGDAGLVSSGEQNLRENLRGDVEDARAQARDAEARLVTEQEFEDSIYPSLVANRLVGRRIALIGLGGLSRGALRGVRTALQATGSTLASSSVIAEPIDLDGLAKRAKGTRYEALKEDPDLAEDLGFRLGTQWLQGGDLLDRVRPALMSSFSGRLEAHEGIVLVREDVELPKDDAAATKAFEKGLVAGLSRFEVPVVGIELTSTKPSQVDWYKDQEISSVDSINRTSGKTALVFLLAGAQKGHRAYGVKSSADDILPPLVP